MIAAFVIAVVCSSGCLLNAIFLPVKMAGKAGWFCACLGWAIAAMWIGVSIWS